MDQKLEKLIKQLGEAINDSISGSEQIAEVISRIKSGGFDVFVIVEATVGFNKPDAESPRAVSSSPSELELCINPQDVQFLESLRISIEPKAGHNSRKLA
ncbi:MAG: hypothetical protein ABSD13_00980 [Candidatus Korobacteraceae bacterium]